MPRIVSDHIQVHPFRRRDGGIEHLLLRRSPEEDLSPGVWQVVTGTIEAGEPALAAARRECLEETGRAGEGWFILPEPVIFYFEPTDTIVLAPVAGCEIAGGEEPILSAEHDDYLWLDGASAIERLPFPSHRSGVTAIESYLRASDGPRG